MIKGNTHKQLIIIAIISISLSLLGGCDSDAPQKRQHQKGSTVVSKKIHSAQTDEVKKSSQKDSRQHQIKNTQGADSKSKKTEEKTSRAKPGTKPQEKQAETKQAANQKDEALAGLEYKDVSENVKETKNFQKMIQDDENAYSALGKIDPFAPLVESETEEREEKDERPKRKLTPLEKFDLSQLKLVAVVNTDSENDFAMVEEANGKGYIVKVGTYIGKRNGTVTEILDDKIIIKERTKNFKGQYEDYRKEMRLHKKFNQ